MDLNDNEQYWLNEFGLREWSSKIEPTQKALRSYHWVDRVIFIDETNDGRVYVGETTFSKFIEHEDHWNPTTKEEYYKLLHDYKLCEDCGKITNNCVCKTLKV